MATITIYEAIGRNLGDIVTKGIPTSGTATGMDSNALMHPQSGQLKGREIYFYEGEGAGQARTITNFAPANNRITVEPDFTTIPTANTRFILFDHFKTEDYENAMNRAIGQIRLIHLDERVATMQLVATQYEYCVPSGFEYIANIRLVPSGNTDYSEDDEVNRITELPPRYWSIEPNAAGSYMIKFDPRKIDMETVDKEWTHVIGQVKPDFSASLIAEELQEYVITRASAIMASTRMNETDKSWYSKFRMFKDDADKLEDYLFKHRRGRAIK